MDEKKLDKIMRDLGFSEAHMGTEALRLCVRHYSRGAGITAAYIDAGRSLGMPYQRVERNIRTAVKRAIEQAGKPAWVRYFGPFPEVPTTGRVLTSLWREVSDYKGGTI